MNVPLMRAPKADARRKLAAVRRQLRTRADEQYRALERAYQQQAKGRPLLNLTDTLRLAGRHPNGLPRLAIARADRTMCWCEVHRDGQVTFDTNRRGTRGWLHGRSFPQFEIRRRLDPVDMGDATTRRGCSIVPLIPPEAREQAGRFRMQDVLILWEVEEWANVANGALPDHDPLLLLPIGGDLFAVLAAWDLTDVERAIMAQRRD